MAETVKIGATPTWEALVPVLVHVAVMGDTPEGRDLALGELLKLARVVDKHIAELGAIRDALPEPSKARLAPDAVCADCGIRGAHTLGCPLGPAPCD